jgi:3-methyladenine DNA glycosylase/8-oxoguanine DNA glycosylase
MQIFKYGQAEIEYLKRRDKKLGVAIDRIGMIEREVTTDLFTALIKSVVHQQISTKAAQTIWARLQGILDEMTPARIAAIEPALIQQCGLTIKKAIYMKVTVHRERRIHRRVRREHRDKKWLMHPYKPSFCLPMIYASRHEKYRERRISPRPLRSQR